MSEAAKARPTKGGVDVYIDGQAYKVPKSKAKDLVKLVKPYAVESGDTVPWRTAFAEEFEKYGEPGYTLQAARAKAGLNQTELSEKTGIRQSHISEMEKGKRAIGKAVAKKLAAALGVDHRIFL